MSNPDRSNKLWSELSREERAEEKKEFLASYAAECGGQPSDYQMQWESYLNQEGWTARDERILMVRDVRNLTDHPVMKVLFTEPK